MAIIRIGLRAQLLFSASFLLAIPYLAYQYVWELESYLRLGQEQTMVGTARAVATALHERPQLFNSQSAFLSDVRPGKDLYAHKIDSAIRLDGNLQDWQPYDALMIDYSTDNLLNPSSTYQPQSLSFRHMVGQFGEYLYAVFDVTDNSVVYRNQNSLHVDRNDFLQIALLLPDGVFQRFIISPFESQWVNAYLLSDANKAVSLQRKIQGQWAQTEKGYNIELRLPLDYLAGQIAFAISDVDEDSNGQVKYSVGTADPTKSDDLGTVLLPSPQIEQIIKGLEYSNSRVWVVDKHKRVLARSGDIQKVSGFSDQTDKKNEGLWQQFEADWLLPLYYQILTKPPTQFVDDLKDAFALKGRDLDQALRGESSTLWRLSSDNKAVILSASHPIFMEGSVMGAVVVEQTTNGIRTLRNKALEQLFHFILAMVIVGSLSLLMISSRISSRIRTLRNDTEHAIDIHGKITQHLSPSKTQDEIGDLSRTFVNVLTRLAQYNDYLENMAARLSHELRTPVAIVNSSLDLLALDPKADDAGVYIDRARDGIRRLSAILTKMSEATRLEQTIQRCDVETFDLVALLNGCVQGYQIAHADRVFTLKASVARFDIQGSPELFAQMLDKITNNAVEFGVNGSEVFINLVTDSSKVRLFISNKGELLPANMRAELMDSMVSLRSDKQQSTSSGGHIEPHLGLGLYLSKMIADFHHASIDIENQSDLSGVVVSLSFN